MKKTYDNVFGLVKTKNTKNPPKDKKQKNKK